MSFYFLLTIVYVWLSSTSCLWKHTWVCAVCSEHTTHRLWIQNPTAPACIPAAKEHPVLLPAVTFPRSITPCEAETSQVLPEFECGCNSTGTDGGKGGKLFIWKEFEWEKGGTELAQRWAQERRKQAIGMKLCVEKEQGSVSCAHLLYLIFISQPCPSDTH